MFILVHDKGFTLSGNDSTKGAVFVHWMIRIVALLDRAKDIRSHKVCRMELTLGISASVYVEVRVGSWLMLVKTLPTRQPRCRMERSMVRV